MSTDGSRAERVNQTQAVTSHLFPATHCLIVGISGATPTLKQRWGTVDWERIKKRRTSIPTVKIPSNPDATFISLNIFFKLQAYN